MPRNPKDHAPVEKQDAIEAFEFEFVDADAEASEPILSEEAPEDGGAPSEAEVESGADSDDAPSANISASDESADAPVEEDEFSHLHPEVAALLRQGYKHSDLTVLTGAGGFVSVSVTNS